MKKPNKTRTAEPLPQNNLRAVKGGNSQTGVEEGTAVKPSRTFDW